MLSNKRIRIRMYMAKFYCQEKSDSQRQDVLNFKCSLLKCLLQFSELKIDRVKPKNLFHYILPECLKLLACCIKLTKIWHNKVYQSNFVLFATLFKLGSKSISSREKQQREKIAKRYCLKMRQKI